MPIQQFVITGFGLQVLRPKLYAANQGTGLQTVEKDYPEAEVEIVNRMNTGADDQEVLSYLGTPVFADLQLQNKAASISLLIDMVLIEVSQAKNIVTTAVQGRSGTVKEYISDGDFDISFRGAIVGQEAHSYPKDEVATLIELMKTQEALEAISPFLQLFGVYDIVVTDYRFPQQEGFQNMQLFEINAISDVPIELVEDA